MNRLVFRYFFGGVGDGPEVMGDPGCQQEQDEQEASSSASLLGGDIVDLGDLFADGTHQKDRSDHKTPQHNTNASSHIVHLASASFESQIRVSIEIKQHDFCIAVCRYFESRLTTDRCTIAGVKFPAVERHSTS